jgi:hypothetical protein
VHSDEHPEVSVLTFQAKLYIYFNTFRLQPPEGHEDEDESETYRAKLDLFFEPTANEAQMHRTVNMLFEMLDSNGICVEARMFTN